MDELTVRYNYDDFVPEKFEPWMNFSSSPALGQKGPDFPLWGLEGGKEVLLSSIWSASTFTVVEFGSFT